jgi:hypothetical protein
VAELFTKGLAENVCKEREANKKETNNVFHHPTTNGVVQKCIDLSCNKPLTKIHTSEHKPKSNSPERWLEAYVIQQAKQSNNYEGVFKLAGNNYRFLYSQLKFPSSGKDKARPLDCLLYEPKTRRLVILELKAERVLKFAVNELDYYASQVNKIRNKLASIFTLDGVSAVEGYIVWPGNKKGDNSKFDFGEWGLIEYSDKYGMIKDGKLVEPWKKCKQNPMIEFVKVKESRVTKAVK